MGKAGSWVKAISDAVLASAALVLSAPLILLCAIAIKLESTGPVFYTQTRLGRGEKPFRIYKLRTMSHDGGTGPEVTQKDDPRVTKVGRFLRRASLDELPQLWNVLRGEMSIVGSRPEVPSIARTYPPELREIFNYKPGITGISQISGRAALPIPEKIRMEIDYYRRENFWSDLVLVLKTPIVLLTGKGNIM